VRQDFIESDGMRSSLVFEGWNIGAVSVKRVRLDSVGTVTAEVRRQGGDPARVIGALLEEESLPSGALVTGTQSASLLSLPYLPESICIEATLNHLGLRPDMGALSRW